MSRITGIYQFSGQPIAPRELWKMGGSVTPYCPDDAAVWTDGCVGLGHVRPWDTAQPQSGPGVLVGQDGQLALTADARIDNRRELVEELGWDRSSASTISDSTLILGAYQRWGERCCEHLLGDFAFALWDGRQQQLFCGRDHLGVRPLYYTTSRGAFAFSSEIKALLSLGWAERQVNELKVADYLMQMPEDKVATFYRGVLRLPPAHTLTVTPTGTRLRQYWQLDPDREVRYSSDEQYAEAYRELFTEAVGCRTRGLPVVGSFLSGGLDSSSVTCVARRLRAEEGSPPLHTFSLIFDEERKCDERPYINAVLSQGGLRPHYVDGDQINPFDGLDRMIQQVEGPFFTPNLFLYWQLYGAAQSHQVPVVLDGLFGDSTVSHGSRYITELAAKGRWLKLAREVNTTARVLGSRRKYYPRLMSQFVLTPLVAEPLQRAWQMLTRPALPLDTSTRFTNREFLSSVGWIERARAFGEGAPRTPTSEKEEHFRELRSGALPGALEIVNKAAAVFGVTPCFPYTDRRLVEYCLAVPATQKYHAGWTRVMARRGLRPYLPEEIYRRYGKTYLQRVLQRGLFLLGREQADSLVFERLPIAARFLDLASLQRAYRQVVQREEYGEGKGHEKTALAIWYALVLTRWLELEKEESSMRDYRPQTMLELQNQNR